MNHRNRNMLRWTRGKYETRFNYHLIKLKKAEPEKMGTKHKDRGSTKGNWATILIRLGGKEHPSIIHSYFFFMEEFLWKPASHNEAGSRGR